jgi:hypothetical protein
MASGPHAPYRRASPTCKSAFPAFGWGSLALIVGMICGDGPCRRWIRKTVLAIAEELTVDERLLRYWLDQPDDGFTARASVHDLLVLLTFAPPVELARSLALGSSVSSCCRRPAHCGCASRRSTAQRAATLAASRRCSPTWPCYWSSGGPSGRRRDPRRARGVSVRWPPWCLPARGW